MTMQYHYLDLNIFQQDECFCSKLGMEVEYAKSSLKTSVSQFWVKFRTGGIILKSRGRDVILRPYVAD